MSKESIKYTYYYRSVPIAEFELKGIKRKAKLIPPFDIYIAGLPNNSPLALDPTKPIADNIFGMKTIGDLKDFIFGKNTTIVK